MAILSKTWWRSLVKSDGTPEDGVGAPDGDQQNQDAESDDDFLFADLEVSDTVVETDLEMAPGQEGEEISEGPSERGGRNRRNRRDRRDRRNGEDRRELREESAPRNPPRAKVTSAKDFFSEEAIYRFDLLLPPQREELKGDYRIEVKGSKGGVWSLKIDNALEIVNRREEAKVVLSIQQKDFIQLINGDLNPQMAILAQKMRVTGDMREVATLQSLLVPPGFD